jgi:multidrug efflux pump subunit AcrB
VDVFRDLGLAFLGALIMIYILLVHETQSFGMPLVIMVAIPLTMIGIIPGFLLLNLVAGGPIHDYPNAIFFTATGMIGMIALAGIVVRNSIILIDFIHLRLQEGLPLEDAVIESGQCASCPSCSRLEPPCSAPGSSPWTRSFQAWPGRSSSASSPPPSSPCWWYP